MYTADCVYPDPPYRIRKYYSPTGYLYPQPGTPVIFDTSQIFIIDSAGYGGTSFDNYWMAIFAIFDTNYVPGVGSYDDSCLAPTGLHAEGNYDVRLALAWNAGGATAWELAVAKQGTSMNSGLLLQTPINYVTIDSLDMGFWYVAQVRSRCDTDIFGPWSDPILFFYGNPDDSNSCPIPVGLTVESTSEGKVVLSWTADTAATSWQVEVGSTATALGDGAVTVAPVAFTMRNGLDTATWHWARVRTVCGPNWNSQWSDTVMFYIPGGSGPDNPDDPNDTTQAITLAEQYTYLMPNPAKDAVTVASSFRVKTVELYASDGKLLQRKEVNAVGTTLSLEGLPAGIYFVRVYTAAGATTKRLLIE